jgi:hypothetical protein
MLRLKKTVAVVLLLLLLLGYGVWAFARKRPDPVVEQMKVEMMANMKRFEEGTMKPEERRRLMEEQRTKMESLTEEQRRQIMEPMRREMERRMNQQMAAYFALPVNQRAAFLDKQIMEMEKRRQQMEAWRAQNPNARGGPGGPGGQGGAGGPGGPPGAGPDGGRPGGGRRNMADMSSEDRMLMRNQRADHSSPEQRAMRSAYRAAMQQRRSQLGLAADPGRGPRPGR